MKTARVDFNFKGRVERLQQQAIVGWARNEENLTEPVQIDVRIGENKIATIISDQEAEAVGLEHNLGYCAFQFALPEDLLTGPKKELEFVYTTTQQNIPGSPFKIGQGCFDTKFTVEYGARLKGRVQQRTVDDAPFRVRLSFDNEVFWTQQYRGGGLIEFSAELPSLVFDSRQHLIQIAILDARGKPVMLTVRKIKHDYHGTVEQITPGKIAGWIANKSYPELPAVIDVVINQRRRFTTQCNIPREDVREKLALSDYHVGFELALPADCMQDATQSIEIFISGTKQRIIARKYVLTPKDIAIRSLMYAAEQLSRQAEEGEGTDFSAGLQVQAQANTWVRQQIIAPIIQQLRKQNGLSVPIQLRPTAYATKPCFDRSDIIDIIIPVYQGYQETLDCINSVLAAKNDVPFEAIVINDKSPDGRLSFKLIAMAREQGFTLIENAKNLGFVGTANIGLSRHKDRDVVLLNSDTVVGDFWLDRLLAASRKDRNIATVTPFSNNATICSFPEFNSDNELPRGVTLEQLNQWFAQTNAGQIQDLPTAIGFCMFIKREVLETIGYLDHKKWQQGYAEENDFCLRAAALGWRHVLATDVFVRHIGSVSFLDDKIELLNHNLARLNRDYPDYPVTVARFIQQDPVAVFRNPVIKQLLLQSSSRYLLFIMHDLGGGAKTHSDHLAQLLDRQGHPVLTLTATSDRLWELRSEPDNLCLKYHYPEGFDQLQTDLRDLGVWRVHFHHVLGLPNQIWQLPELLECPYDFTAHDFLPMCPRINLIDETQRFCDKSQYDEAKCQRCIQLNGLPEVKGIDDLWRQMDESVSRWRGFYADRLRSAEHVFCPSQHTARLYKKQFSLNNLTVHPHPERAFPIGPRQCVDEAQINVAVIGAIGLHKGYQLLLDCARYALKEGLPLHFVVIGFTCDDESLAKLDNVTITGAYNNGDELQQWIEQYQCRLALFLSTWPETFCYALTEALQNHLYPVALNFGAVAERIKSINYGKLISANANGKEVAQQLLRAETGLREQAEAQLLYPGAEYPDLIRDYYQLT